VSPPCPCWPPCGWRCMTVSPLLCACQPVLLCRCVRAAAAAGVHESTPGALNTFMKAHAAHVVMYNTTKKLWEFHSPVAKKAVVRERWPAVRGAFLQFRARPRPCALKRLCARMAAPPLCSPVCVLVCGLPGAGGGACEAKGRRGTARGWAGCVRLFSSSDASTFCARMPTPPLFSLVCVLVYVCVCMCVFCVCVFSPLLLRKSWKSWFRRPG